MLFFFVKHKTAYELRISDWSSDVCSSDLLNVLVVVDLAVDGQDHRAVLVHHRLPALLRQVENAEPAMTDIDVAADPFAPLVRPPMRQSGQRAPAALDLLIVQRLPAERDETEETAHQRTFRSAT